MVEFPFFVSSVCVCCCVSLFPVFNLFACIYCLYMGLVAWYKKWNKQETRNILDCDQSNYSSRIILAHIPAKLLSWSWIIQRIPEIGLYSFEIFQDDVRPLLGFGSTGSRSIQYANPEKYISTKHMDSALFAIRKLSQLKAAILFPASKLYSIRTVGYPDTKSSSNVLHINSDVMWCCLRRQSKLAIG